MLGIGEFARKSGLSPKALRRYDELGLLPPASVDPGTGYRWYTETQLDPARLVAALRQLGVPLALVKTMISLPSADAAAQLSGYWSAAEADHSARRQLAGFLIDRLNGKRSVMYEVELRDVPARSMLCLLRHVADNDAVQALGREFIPKLADPRMLKLAGPAGATLLLYHGEVSEDSDGPVEWCQPVPADRADQIAACFPDLTLRAEPAHQEAFVHFGQAELSAAQWQLVSQALRSWVAEQRRSPSELGVRVCLRASPGGASRPDCDFALPLA
jgi:DNA-binding transcriptional MerR regulator